MALSEPGDGALAGCADVHIVAEDATALDDDMEVEVFGSGWECARKAARKLLRNGLWVGMVVRLLVRAV